MERKFHIPVMVNEVLEYLNLESGQVILDATVGTGGHALNILEQIMPKGKLIALDQDEESLRIAKERLKPFKERCSFIHSNFSELDSVLKQMDIDKVDGMLFDLGISSFQLDDSGRGFSFKQDGPLDMRLDRGSMVSAYDLLNNLNEEEISKLLWDFGQERWHNRIARFLVQARERQPITTTREFSDLIVRATPSRYRHYRIHPATRSFQAVRIAVNRELEVLEKTMNKVFDLLNPGGRICVISFHSLEDRIIKWSFKRAQQNGLIKILTTKPVIPYADEIKDNPSSRSSKLRAAERL